jgi:hypothetical protein
MIFDLILSNEAARLGWTTKNVHIYLEYHSVCTRPNWDPPHPLSRKRLYSPPRPRNLGGGRVRGVGGPNLDDCRKRLTLSVYSVGWTVLFYLAFSWSPWCGDGAGADGGVGGGVGHADRSASVPAAFHPADNNVIHNMSWTVCWRYLVLGHLPHPWSILCQSQEGHQLLH